MVVDPPNGRVPLKPEAIARRDATLAQDAGSLLRYGPWERCITRGVPGSMWPGAYNNGHQIVQTRDYVVLHSEMIHEARVIPLTARPHLGAGVRTWDGDSRARWDGDTLVIDTTNFNGKGGSRPTPPQDGCAAFRRARPPTSSNASRASTRTRFGTKPRSKTRTSMPARGRWRFR